jgi:hypothetical protein
MASNYDNIDLLTSWNMDYVPGEDGDLADNSGDQILSLTQEIQTIANSSLGDWEEHPQYAASLDDFVGEPNNRDTSRAIVERLRTALITNNVVRSEDLIVKIVPISRHQVLIIVSVDATPTQNNSIIKNAPAVVSIIYDYQERGLFFLDQVNK